ncbi:MAG: hypothetical protein A2511_00505 [Deltaproteobacteria bacterium RIFOXYD12_FULL_50_9]|nr:MAG: hypothetical protein A2511_00505 [Deltaproteobacteria bacterium RIFOXYD12_FULL_50_9]
MKIQLLVQEKYTVQQLGVALKKARLAAGQTHEDFAARIGVSRWTVSQMEKGNPGVALAAWIKAAGLLGLLDTFNGVLAPPPDPFDEYDAAQKTHEDLLKARVRKRR